MSPPLAKHRALITGAGHGLGKAIAFALASAGAEVIVTDRDAERVHVTVEELSAAKFAAAGYPLDVTSVDQVAAVRAECGPVSILVNNAGVVFGGDFLSVPIDRHLAMVGVNLNGLLTVTHAFLPGLISSPRASLVNIASMAAVVPLPCGTSYAASKSAVLAFSESLREELQMLRHQNVHVGTVCPSYISTGLFAGAKPARFTWMLTPETVAAAVVRTILRRRQTVMLPWTAAGLHAVTRFLPATLYRGLCRRLGVSSSMTNWRGHS
ncbi:MAG: SDR family NAD(P)-dependent oxidoreductase [Gemmataceae bacterium]